MTQKQVSVTIRLNADGSGLIGQTKLSREELAKLGKEFQQSGRKAQGFGRDADQAKGSTERLSSGIGSLRSVLGMLGVSLSVAGFSRLINDSTAAADRISKLSGATGVATDDLQRLKFMASQTGLDFEQLARSITFLQRQMVDNKEVRAFAEALDLREMDTVGQLSAIADQFGKITDPAERSASAVRLFGRAAGPEMLNLLEQGSAGIRTLGQQLDGMGKLTEAQIAAAVKFRDTWDTVTTSLRTTVQSGVMAALMDDTGGMSQSFEDLRNVLTSTAMRDAITSIVRGITSIATTAANAVVGLRDLYNAARILSGLGGVTDRGGTEAARQELDLLREYERVQGDVVQILTQRAAIVERMGQVELDIAREAMQGTIDQLDEQLDRLSADQAARQQRIETLRDERQAFRGSLEVQIDTGAEAANVMGLLIGETDRLATTQRTAAREIDQFAAEFERLYRTLDPTYAATEDYAASVDTLDRAWADGLISGEQYWALLNKLATGSEALTKAAEPLIDDTPNAFLVAWEEAIRRIDGAFVDMWDSVISGTAGSMESIRRMFQQLLAQMAHAALTRPIMLSIGMGGALGTSSASAAGGGFGSTNIGGLNFLTGGAGPAGFLNSIVHGSATGPFQTATGAGMFGGSAMGFGLAGLGGGLIGSQFGGYGAVGGSIGGMAGMSIASGGSALGSAMGSALGSVAPVIGTAIGAVIGGFLGGLFGDRTPGTQGQRAAWSDSLDLSTNTVTGLHGGNAQLEEARDVATAIVQATVAGIQSLGGEIDGEIRELGTGIRNGWQVIIEGQMQLFGDDFEGLFAHIFDYLLDSTTGLDDATIALLANVETAEEALRTLEIAGYLEPLNAVLERINQQALPMSASGISSTSGLVEMFGGMDVLMASTAQYYQAFFSEAERAGQATQDMTSTLAEFGQALPESRDAFRALVESQDLSTESGREMFAVLMAIAPTFDWVASSSGELGESLANLAEIERERAGLERQILQLTGDTNALRALELATLDPSNQALQQRIYELQDEAELAAQLAAIAAERTGLEQQILQLTGDTAALRALELEALDPGNRALQERIHELQDEAAIATQLAAIAAERAGLETQLLQVQGDAQALRELELASLDESNRELLQHIWSLEDAADAAADAAAETQALADQWDSLAGITAASISAMFRDVIANAANEVDAVRMATEQSQAILMDGLANAVLEHVSAAMYEAIVQPVVQSVVPNLLAGASATAAGGAAGGAAVAQGGYIAGSSLAAIVDQAISMINVMSQILGDAGFQAAMAEIGVAFGAVGGAMWSAPAYSSPGFRPPVSGGGGSGSGSSDYNNVASERAALERKLLQLQGDTVALRRLELNALHPSNRALQNRIWALEDELRIAAERETLERQLLQLQGDTAALRALELESLDASNRELQERIYALEDEQALVALYHEMLGRAPDTAGLEYWLDAVVNAGVTLEEVAASIRESTEYLHGVTIPQLMRDLESAVGAYRRDLEAAHQQRMAQLTAEIDAMRSNLEQGLAYLDRAYQAEIAAIEDAHQVRMHALQEEAAYLRQGLTDAMGLLQRSVAAEQEAMTRLHKDTMRSYNDQIKANNDAIKIHQENAEALSESLQDVRTSISALSQLASTLQSALRSMRIDDDAYQMANRAQGMAYLSGLAASGTLPAADDPAFQRALQSVTAPSEHLHASFEDYQREFWQAYNLLDDIEQSASEQLTTEEAMLASLEAAIAYEQEQIESLKEINEAIAETIAAAQEQHQAEIDALNGILREAQRQTDAALGLDSSVTSVESALAAVRQAVASASALPAIEAQIAQEQEQHIATLALLQEQYDVAREQATILLGIDANVLSMADAMEYLAAAIDAAENLPGLENEAETLTGQHREQMDALDAMLEEMRTEVEILLGIDSGLAAIEAALGALRAVVPTTAVADWYSSVLGREAEQAAIDFWAGLLETGQITMAEMDQLMRESAVPEVTAAIEQIYRDVLGREAEEEGLGFWIDQFLAGLSLAAMEAAIRAGAAASGEIPGFASGGTHSGGLRMVGERGPELEFTGPSRIISHADIERWMRQDAVVSEVRALRREMDATQRAIAYASAKSSRLLERWDGDGLPAEREEITA